MLLWTVIWLSAKYKPSGYWYFAVQAFPDTLVIHACNSWWFCMIGDWWSFGVVIWSGDWEWWLGVVMMLEVRRNSVIYISGGMAELRLWISYPAFLAWRIFSVFGILGMANIPIYRRLPTYQSPSNHSYPSSQFYPPSFSKLLATHQAFHSSPFCELFIDPVFRAWLLRRFALIPFPEFSLFLGLDILPGRLVV